MVSVLEQLITWSKDLKILYVEDDVTLREELSILFSDIFACIDLAQNGQEGLEKIEKNHYDFVITDIRMPVMDGIEMIERLKNEGSTLPIVVLSAHNESDYLIKLINLGIDNFVTKPMRSEQVFSVLHKVIQNIHQDKELRRYKQELELANDKLKKIIKQQSKSIDFKTSILKSYKDAIYGVALVSIADKEGVIKDVNENFCKALGYTKEELIGKKHSIFKHPDTDPKTYKQMWETILSKRVWHGMLINQTKTFHPVYHYTTIIPVLDEKDEIYEFLAVKQDLTRFEELNQEKFAKNIECSISVKLDDILKTLPFSSVIFDKKSKITHHNKLFENFVADLSDVAHYTNLLSKNLHVSEIVSFKGLVSLRDSDFIDSICDINETVTLEVKTDSIRGEIECIIKIKKLDDENYIGCFISKEDVESCFLAQEN